jgi:hypothetical protein
MAATIVTEGNGDGDVRGMYKVDVSSRGEGGERHNGATVCTACCSAAFQRRTRR